MFDNQCNTIFSTARLRRCPSLQKAKNVSKFCSIRLKNHTKIAIFDAFPSIWRTYRRCGKQYPDLLLKVILSKIAYLMTENEGNEDVFETQKNDFGGITHSFCNGRVLSWRALSGPFGDVGHCSSCSRAMLQLFQSNAPEGTEHSSTTSRAML